MRGARWGGVEAGQPRRGRWSQAEIARLREVYGLKEDVVIARELNRPEASVRKMAASVFPLAVRQGPWTAKEVLELKRYLGAASHEVIARVLGRTPDEVRERISDLGRIRGDGPWSQDEIVEFKRLYGTRRDEDMELIFGRSRESLANQADVLCLAKDKAFVRRQQGASSTRMPRWSAEEVAKLVELYPDHSNLDIARSLSRSVKSVVSKAHNLGLKKDADRLRTMGRENVSLRYRRRESERQVDRPGAHDDAGEDGVLEDGVLEDGVLEDDAREQDAGAAESAGS